MDETKGIWYNARMTTIATGLTMLGTVLALQNPHSGMRVTFSDKGARFVRVEVRDRAEELRTVTAPQIDPFSGATLGRVANRIADSRFTLEGKVYELPSNESPNGRACLLHGGAKGFYRQVWEMKRADRDGMPGVVFTRRSPDGEEGFPGNLDVKVTYVLTDANALRIEYEAVTDRVTPVQMTNHGYFNLNGDPNVPIDNHTLWIAGWLERSSTSASLRALADAFRRPATMPATSAFQIVRGHSSMPQPCQVPPRAFGWRRGRRKSASRYTWVTSCPFPVRI